MTPRLPDRAGPGAGFTLIELLMVIIIIGVAAGAVRLAVSTPDPLDDLQRSAEQLAYRFGQVQDRVLLSNREQGLALVGEGVQFLQWREGDPREGEPDIVWEPNADAPGWQAPEGTRLELRLEGQWVEIPETPPENELDWQPLVLLLPSEDYQPAFELDLRPPGIGTDAVRLSGDGFNRPEVRRVSL